MFFSMALGKKNTLCHDIRQEKELSGEMWYFTKVEGKSSNLQGMPGVQDSLESQLPGSKKMVQLPKGSLVKSSY